VRRPGVNDDGRVRRLIEAADRTARTNELRPIPVTGSDQIARLTASFNTMVDALAALRDRQARLVRHAASELRTPLTSLRTKIELLMALTIPAHDASTKTKWRSYGQTCWPS
jgi:two-component system, OmpR family, sensor histidine kinase MprB